MHLPARPAHPARPPLPARRPLLAPVGRPLALVAFVGALILLVGPNASAQSAPTTLRPMRVAVTPVQPFVEKRNDGYAGFSIQLWEEIARRNHYESIYVDEPSVEAQLDAVRRGEADVAIGDITPNVDRAKLVDFTDTTIPAGLQIMVAQSQAGPVSGLWEAVTDRTVLVLLLFMAVAVLAAAITIWLLERGSNPDFDHSAKKGVGEGTWWATVTLLTVGYGDRVPRSGSGRSFSIGWMLFGMLLVAAVTATFTANLTVHRLNTTISTPDDLRDHSTVTVKDSIAALAMKERRIPVTEVATTDEMVAAVRNGTAEAAVYEAPVLARAVHESEGNLALAGPQFTHSFDAFAVPLGNDQRQAINLALLAMLGDGAYDHIYRSWFAT